MTKYVTFRKDVYDSTEYITIKRDQIIGLAEDWMLYDATAVILECGSRVNIKMPLIEAYEILGDEFKPRIEWIMAERKRRDDAEREHRKKESLEQEFVPELIKVEPRGGDKKARAWRNFWRGK